MAELSMLSNQIQNYDNIVNLNIGFTKSTKTISKSRVDIYSYRYTDFKNFKDYNAYELRGSSVVYQNNKPLRFYYSVPKFFNLNQTDETQLNIIKTKTISKVYEKLDGSLIQFIRLPNGDIVAKSKTSFETSQALEAQRIYLNTPELFDFINKNVDNYNLLFEYISYNNQIVVNYNVDTLRLIQVRDLEGKFIDLDTLKGVDLDPKFIVKSVNLTLDEILDIVENSTDDIEGFVVYFTDSTIVKFKTLEYLRKHKLLTNNPTKKELVNMIINETIDDYIANLQGVKYSVISNFNSEVIDKINYYQKYIKEFDYSLDRKSFAIQNRNNPDFSLLMRCYGVTDDNQIESEILKYIERNADSLFELKFNQIDLSELED